ncbi:MAG: NADPH-dependent F420 reductase [Acidimicrobiales bacterium]|jgi:NADPH-dependent F420 reductase
MVVGIIGGTGPLGSGLALRLAAVGESVVIGSREAARAEQVVGELLAKWPGRDLDIRGSANSDAGMADIVFVATPWESAVETISALRDELEGRLVISVGNALMKIGREFQAVVPPRGSVAALVQATLPRSRVAAAGHHLPASALSDLDGHLDSDVLVCADDPEVGKEAIELIVKIDGLRAFYAGSLASAATIEAFTAVLVTLNIKNKAHTTLKIAGL